MTLNSPYTIWLAIVCVIAGSVLAMLQLSVREVVRSTLEARAQVRNKPHKTKLIGKILDTTDEHSAALGLPRVLMNLFATILFVGWVWHMRGVAAPGWTELLLGLLLSSFFVWVLGTVIPIAVAEHAAEVVVYSFSPLIRACAIVFWPLTHVSAILNEIVRRLAGRHEADEQELRDAEVLSVLEDGERDGAYDEDERDMIEAVLEFKATTVESIMTPRTEIEAIELTDDLGEITRIAREKHHSRIPVYEGDLDHIVGIFYVKDLLHWLADAGPLGRHSGSPSHPFALKDILRPAVFVPETKTIRELLAELLASRVHIAMIADEYGGTSGLVTIEDIIEEIFGEIQDEYEEPEPDEMYVDVDLSRGVAEIDAREEVDDANDELEPLGVALPESDDYDTVGGFVMTTLGRIPAVGESFQFEKLHITIIEAEPTRVGRVRIELKEPEQAVAAK
ncbi:MAG: HlyC/CorC family transporter [Phycisphaeraceae bacterium]|nr:HlyC/CorC family transporter [Phycisphaerales bacterium]MCB9859953.1 HlyC/CorC family transporter [Phycisphaeraceae bacterium]